jgi:hypothetical protein
LIGAAAGAIVHIDPLLLSNGLKGLDGWALKPGWAGSQRLVSAVMYSDICQLTFGLI